MSGELEFPDGHQVYFFAILLEFIYFFYLKVQLSHLKTELYDLFYISRILKIILRKDKAWFIRKWRQQFLGY